MSGLGNGNSVYGKQNREQLCVAALARCQNKHFIILKEYLPHPHAHSLSVWRFTKARGQGSGVIKEKTGEEVSLSQGIYGSLLRRAAASDNKKNFT